MNGDVDGQTGRLQEVGQQVPLDDPRLGDAHLNIMTQLFDLATSLWEDDREEEESLVREFNIASRFLSLLLALVSLLHHSWSPESRRQKWRSQNCPTCQLISLLGWISDS